jgi:xanthine dehydrogenase accessory factor
VKVGGTDFFLHAYNPPLRLIVVGAVHIAQALVPFATQCGFAVVVVDPRRSFASDERFPNVTVSNAWPDEALDELKPDTRTAVVTLTHDPKLDDPALDRALKSRAFYIGSLGSRRTHAARLKRLRELGHGDNALQRIQGPVGLNLEAVTAPEIALSIIAELVAVRRGAPLPQRQSLAA